MAKAQDEIQHIISRLTYISVHLRPSSSVRVVPPKPSGSEYLQVQSDMHRLLILRGMARENEKVPVDVWDMFLDEFFGPRMRGSTSQPRRPASPYPCAASGSLGRHVQAPVPVVRDAIRNGAREHRQRQHYNQQQQQQQGSSSSTSTSTTMSEPGPRVRFQSPLPRPHR